MKHEYFGGGDDGPAGDRFANAIDDNVFVAQYHVRSKPIAPENSKLHWFKFGQQENVIQR